MPTIKNTQGAYSRIQLRRGTAYEWKAINPILSKGEFVIEVPDEGVGTGLSKFKIGDGVNHYADLPYCVDGSTATNFYGGNASSTDSGVLQLRADTLENWNTVNPVLALNEYVYCTTNKGFKMGDGKSKWSELPWLEFGSEWDKDLNVITDCGDEEQDIVNANSTTDLENLALGTTTSYKNYAKANGKSVDTYDSTLLPKDWDKNLNTKDAANTETKSDSIVSTADLFK